jgi:hemoglobin
MNGSIQRGNMNGITKRSVRQSALVTVAFTAFAFATSGGCGNPEQKDRDFHTSGSREADQRAEQRVAKVQQLRGEGSNDDKEEKGNVKRSLFERLGGEEGIALIVEDWVNRAIADPRVNWERKGVKKGGFGFDRGDSVEWPNTPENGTRMKKHIAQFIANSTGGPTLYEGKEMKPVHAPMQITNDEFEAAIGDLKASLDNLGVPTEEQKELLAVIETARPQIVSKR